MFNFPRHYLITPDGHQRGLLAHIEKAVCEYRIRLIQIRAHSLSQTSLENLLKKLAVSDLPPVQLLLNSHFPQAQQTAQTFGVGVHWQSQALMRLKQRPLESMLMAGSCHTSAELQQAETLGLDFAVLSPVKYTTTHPDKPPLGWSSFEQLCARVRLPVYALGGMQLTDAEEAHRRGAHGVAGIRLTHPRG